MEGVDYSYDRPDPAGLAAAGKRFAVRYVGTPSSGKSLDLAEAQALGDAGVDLVATYETSAGFMASADGGLAAGRARAHALACGMPEGRPIYFALDVDPARLTSLERAAVERFLTDAAAVIGPDAVGVYGAFSAIEWLVPRFARWGWQTYAWSGDRWSSKAHLTQYRNGVSLAGGTVDLCASKTTDFGQWGIGPEEDDMTPEQAKTLETIATKVNEIAVSVVPARQAAQPKDGRYQVQTLIAPLLAGRTDVDEAELAQAVVAALPVDALAAAIAEQLPDEDQSALLDALAARLAS